jgi:aromatic ring-opening dioxygenase catalytic subunit (LigB family)
MKAFLEGLPGTLPSRPRAIVVVSAHWEEPAFTVNVAANPSLLYDYYGFPEHTYRLQYPVAGSPELAARIVELLGAAGIESGTESKRGLDHGVFIPFKLIFPDADIPVVQLSLCRDLDPVAHIRAGQALAALRDEGVLIVGSGMSYHNLRAFGPAGAGASKQFDDWLSRTVEIPDEQARNVALGDWSHAPSASSAHPREEHLLPLMVIAGAAGADRSKKIFEDSIVGLTVSAFQFG